MKPSEKSLQLAAQCWCDEETKNTVMDTDLAVAFAKRLDQKDEIIQIMIEKIRGAKANCRINMTHKDHTTMHINVAYRLLEQALAAAEKVGHK